MEDSSAGALHGAPTVDISVVVPYFNPGNNVVSTLADLDAELRRSGFRYEIVAVSDGSTDGSPAAVDAMADGTLLRSFGYPANEGKGAALRYGFQRCNGRWVGFIDADGDISPDHIVDQLRVAEAVRADGVVASKRHPLAAVEFNLLRALYSRGFQLVNRVLFRLPVRDTQVGCKVFRRDVLADVLPVTSEAGFALDLELLVAAKRRGHRYLVESPVRICRSGVTTVRASTALRMGVNALSIAWRDRVKQTYHR